MEQQTDIKNKQPDYFNQQPHYRNAQEYAQALRSWMTQYHTFCAMQTVAAQSALHHISHMHMSRDLAPRTPGADPYAARRSMNVSREPAAHDQQQQQPPGFAGPPGVVFKVPSFWKRIAAELIDFTLLFYIKMLVSLSLLSELNLDQMSIFGTEEIFDSFNDLDYERAFAITFEVIALEIINRVIITIFETMCLYRARVRGQHVGATPGKRFMGLKVVACTYVRDLGYGQVLVLPAGRISLKNAFLRSVIKNFTIAFFLPACLTMFFFKHNRTAYDVIAHTIVVENI